MESRRTCSPSVGVATSKSKALLLGMVYSEETEPKRGQEFRDRVRCEALEAVGTYDIYSLDNKHSSEGAKLGKHVRANFSDARRMTHSIRDAWGQVCFDIVILDYFFSPAGWARERWTDHFFKETLPALSKNGLLKPGGTIWLPYLDCVQDSVSDFNKELTAHFTIKLVSDPMLNPLYAATEMVEDDLSRCPDLLTNETQIKPLHSFSSTPFLTLTAFEGKPDAAYNGPEGQGLKLQQQPKTAAPTVVDLNAKDFVVTTVHVVTPTKSKSRRSRIRGNNNKSAAANSDSSTTNNSNEGNNNITKAAPAKSKISKQKLESEFVLEKVAEEPKTSRYYNSAKGSLKRKRGQ